MSVFLMLQALVILNIEAESWQFRHYGIDRFTMVDVGQGDGFIFKSASGFTLMVDVGEHGDVLLSGLKNFYSHTSHTMVKSIMSAGIHPPFNINALFLSHDDADHAGSLSDMPASAFGWVNPETGFINLFKRHILRSLGPIYFGHVYISEYKYTYVRNITTSNSGSKYITKLKKGDYIHLAKKINIQVLHPPVTSQDISSVRSANDNSLVFLLNSRNTNILFTGDISKKIEQQVLQTIVDEDKNKHNSIPKNISIDFLKIAHHGSKTSSSPDFLGAIIARFYLISSGRNNRYKHPHKDVVQQIDIHTASTSAKTLRTDICKHVHIYIFEGGVVGYPTCQQIKDDARQN